jgi:hypothetical protein
MNKILTLASIVAIMFSPVAFSADTGTDAASNPYHVTGEKLDSGLGDLSYGDVQPQAEQNTEVSGLSASNPYHVAGEKIDSGLDSWQPSVQVQENIVLSGYSVPGEKLDSGL